MVAYLVVNAIFLAVSLPIGLALLHLATGSARSPVRTGDRFFVTFWLGILTAANLLLAISLILPLRPVGSLVAISIPVIAAVVWQPVRSELRQWLKAGRWIALAVIVGIVGGALALRPVRLYDTSLYHYQLIRWLHEYGSVPGLALIHERFGFVSSWFAAHAVFDTGVLQERGMTLLAGLVLSGVIAQAGLGFGRWIGGHDVLSDRAVAISLSIALAATLAGPWRGLIASPSPDLPALFLPVIVSWAMLVNYESETSRSERPGVVWLLAVLALPLKLTMVPLVAVIGLWEISRQPSTNRLLQMGISGGLSLAPIIAVSLEVSGCLIFPLAATCFDVPSGVTSDIAHAMSIVIREWAQWGGPTPAGAGSWAWLPAWLAQRPLGGRVELFSIAGILVLLIVGAKQRQGAYLTVAAVAIVGSAFVFLTGPDWRFMAGYLFPAIGAGIAVALTFVPKDWSRAFAGAVVGLGAALLLVAMDLPPPVRPSPMQPEPVTQHEGGSDWSYSVPVNGDRCGTAPLPCVSRQLPDDAVSLRGHSLEQGFRRPDDR